MTKITPTPFCPLNMDISEFRALVRTVKGQHTKWFALDSDSTVDDEVINGIEEKLGVTLPPEYRSFLKEFGGGYFALANVFSAVGNSDWNIVERNERAGLLGKGYVAISDNGAGDLYGFRCKDGACESGIWIYDHDSSEWHKTSFDNLFTFLKSKALSR